jgi:hypothetical protein
MRRQPLVGQSTNGGQRQRIKAMVISLYEDRRLTPCAKDVALALLFRFMNYKNGACFPSYETIAKKVRWRRAAIATALKLLRERGVLNWHKRFRRVGTRLLRDTNSYWFVLPKAESNMRTVTINQVLSLLSKEEGGMGINRNANKGSGICRHHDAGYDGIRVRQHHADKNSLQRAY